MLIILKREDLLLELFPESKLGENEVEFRNSLVKFYSYGPYKPKITIDSDFVTIEIDIDAIEKQEPDFNKVVSLCEQGRFQSAKPILENLIKANPTNSEYHRIYGQILSEEGDQDGAINSLIDALRWDPRNGYALIMMGNVQAKYKDDIDTAIKYYDQAIKINPNDFIAINNLGTNLIQLGKDSEGLKYLEKAYSINPEYPNTCYGLALINERLGDKLKAFDYCIEAMKKSKGNQNLFNHALALTIQTAEEWTKTDAGKKAINSYKSYLQNKGQIEIRVEIDNQIPTSAKFEFAENYNRDYHLVKYRSNHQGVEHLVMHEFVHLDLAIDAKKENINMLFITNGEMKAKFIKDNQRHIEKLAKEGYEESSITNFINSLFEGINRQIFNAPIDIFIEDYLYKTYKELRPFQFISLYQILSEGRQAVTDKKGGKLTPGYILKASKILNLVAAIQFRELYGFNLVPKFEANALEIKQAEKFWYEYLEYSVDRAPGEEYELVEHWGQDLGLKEYFELVNEKEFRNKRTDIDNILSSIESDPFDLNSQTIQDEKKEQTDLFVKNQQEIGLNMAVVMFMVGALKYFAEIPKSQITKIAFEIALLGSQGFDPQKSGYKISSMPGKEFSGYHILSYYYVSFKLSMPEMLEKLKLPFDKEFDLAQTMYTSGGY